MPICILISITKDILVGYFFRFWKQKYGFRMRKASITLQLKMLPTAAELCVFLFICEYYDCDQQTAVAILLFFFIYLFIFFSFFPLFLAFPSFWCCCWCLFFCSSWFSLYLALLYVHIKSISSLNTIALLSESRENHEIT